MLTQSFGDIGEEIANEADTVTAVEFDECGEYLATGDRGGRIVVFKYNGVNKTNNNKVYGSIIDESSFWSPFFQFQSHDTEFDYLKSLEIEEKINQIKFCKPILGNLFLLSTNDKTIKLWKVSDRPHYYCEALSAAANERIRSPNQLPLPRTVNTATNDLGIANTTVAIPRRLYQNAHSYHINSLSLCSDGQTFLSADDLTVNLWNFERSDCSFNIIDIKPSQMEELTEVITATQFHPSNCNILGFSSSKASSPPLNYSRMPILNNISPTVTSLSDSVRLFRQPDDIVKSNYSDIITSISDMEFTHDGRYMISRDYLTVKIWDLNMESRPIQSIPVHDHLRPLLPNLYESEAIFDKFELFVSPSTSRIVTGSYSNFFSVHSFDGNREYNIQLPMKSPVIESNRTSPSSSYSRSPENGGLNGMMNGMKSMSSSNRARLDIRTDQKVLHGAWHPNSNLIAIAGQSGLFMYTV
eukprot:gene20979-27187_t